MPPRSCRPSHVSPADPHEAGCGLGPHPRRSLHPPWKVVFVWDLLPAGLSSCGQVPLPCRTVGLLSASWQDQGVKTLGPLMPAPQSLPPQGRPQLPKSQPPHPGNAGSPRGLCQAVFAKYTAPRKYLAGVPRAPALWTHLWVAEAPPLPAPARAGDCGRPWALGAWELPRCLFVLGCLGGAATLCQLLA